MQVQIIMTYAQRSAIEETWVNIHKKINKMKLGCVFYIILKLLLHTEDRKLECLIVGRKFSFL